MNKLMKKIGFIGILIALCLIGYVIIHQQNNSSDKVTIQKYSLKKFEKDTNKGLKKAGNALTVDGTICPKGNDDECEPGQHCVDGTCSTGMKDSRCRQSGDCDPSYYCHLAICTERVSQYSHCDASTHPCKPGLVCSKDHQCVKECVSSGTCKQPEGSDCHINKECQDNLYCNNEKCVKRLTTGSSCIRDQSCADGLTCKDLNIERNGNIKNMGTCSK